MTLTPTQARTQALRLVTEQVAEIASSPDDELTARCHTIFSLAAFSLYEVTESRLRSFLRIGGINLLDEEEFEVASGVASCFVLSKALIVTGLERPSLIDLEHVMLKSFVLNDEVMEIIEGIKFEGIMWRESLLDVDL